jgi:hypothetical protein
MASYFYRTAQPFILAAFLPWGGSTGAGRKRLAGAKICFFFFFFLFFQICFLSCISYFDGY